MVVMLLLLQARQQEPSAAAAASDSAAHAAAASHPLTLRETLGLVQAWCSPGDAAVASAFLAWLTSHVGASLS